MSPLTPQQVFAIRREDINAWAAREGLITTRKGEA
jgi:hypothetical protein